MKLKNLKYNSNHQPTSLLIAILLLTIGSLGITTQTNAQQREVADMIVTVVNDNIILKSDVDSLVRSYQMQQQGQQQRPFSKELWYSVLNSEIEKNLILEQAKIDSVTVSEEELSRKVNMRINQMVQQAGSEQVIEDYFGKSMIELRRDWRDVLRNDEIVNKMRQQKMQNVRITRPEVVEFYNSIPSDSLPTIPEQVKMAQIVKIPEPSADARASALELAKTLRDSVVNHGKTIEDLAKRHSEGPSAAKGGLLPMINVNDLVPEYSAAASALQPGEISNVVETTFGFHVIRLNKRIGDKISTNHILIKVDDKAVDNDGAKEELLALKDSVETHGKDFMLLARRYSDDEGTSSTGGVVRNPQTGESYIPLTQLDPSLYSIALLLEEGEISDPKQYTTNPPNSKKAFRIVKLIDRIDEHEANLKQDYSLIEQNALSRKKQRFYKKWIKEMKEDFYVEIRIGIPEEYQPLLTTVNFK